MTKASVTLTFCSNDQEHCPIARQIDIEGKNKYVINGKFQQNNHDQELLCFALKGDIKSYNDTTKSNEAEVLAIDDKIQEIQETMNNVGILIKYFLFLIKRF